jgi:hypothetical protein
VRYVRWLGNLLRLDLGKSYAYQQPVWDVIVSKMPISIFFGLTSFVLAYLVSVPLGVAKAIRNRSTFDTATRHHLRWLRDAKLCARRAADRLFWRGQLFSTGFRSQALCRISSRA